MIGRFGSDSGLTNRQQFRVDAGPRANTTPLAVIFTAVANAAAEPGVGCAQ